VLFTYGGRVAQMWWEQNRSTLEKIGNLTVFRLAPEDTQALAALANRVMRLQCLIQDGEMLITGEGESVRIEPEVVFGKP